MLTYIQPELNSTMLQENEKKTSALKENHLVM